MSSPKYEPELELEVIQTEKIVKTIEEIMLEYQILNDRIDETIIRINKKNKCD